MKILHVNSDEVKTYNLTFVIRDFDGVQYIVNKKVKDGKVSIKIPAKKPNEEYSHECPVYVLATKNDDALSFAELLLKNPEDIEYSVNLKWGTPYYDIEDNYEIEEDSKLNSIRYERNFIDPYDLLEDFHVDEIKIQVNGYWVDWMPITGLKPGEYKYNVKIVTKNGYEYIKTINVKVKERAKTEVPKIEPIKFNYAFFAPLTDHNFKPTVPVVCFISNNIVLKKVEFYYNDILLGSSDTGKGIIDLDVSHVPAYKPVGIKAVFEGYDKNTNDPVHLVDNQTIYISDKMNLKITHNYEDDKKVFKFKLEGTDEELNNISKILFNVRFESTITEEVVEVAGYKQGIESSVVFESEVDPSNPEIEIDFKMASNYYITAYVYDKAGNIHTLTDSVKQLSSDSDKTYFINDKISIIIRSSINENPAFDLFYVESDGATKVGTFLTEKLYDDLYSGGFTVKRNDCVYVTKIGKAIKPYYVGDSRNVVVLRVNPDGELPKYVFRDENGEVKAQGTVTRSEVDPELGYIILPLHTPGIVKIGERTYKKIY